MSVGPKLARITPNLAVIALVSFMGVYEMSSRDRSVKSKLT